MHKQDFIPITAFADLHNIRHNHLEVAKSIGRLPACSLKMDGYKAYIDKNFYERRNDFRRKVLAESHEIYYFLREFYSEFKIASMIAEIDNTYAKESWYVFLNGRLFGVDDSSAVVFKISGMLWNFYRYGRWLVQAIFIKEKTPKELRNITKILDKKYL